MKPNRNPKENPTLPSLLMSGALRLRISRRWHRGQPRAWLRECHVDTAGWCGLWCSPEWSHSPDSLLRPQEEQQLLWTCWPWAAEQWDVKNQSPSSNKIYGSCWEHRERPSWGVLLSFLPRNRLFLISFMPSLNDHPIHHALFASKDHEKQAEMS